MHRQANARRSAADGICLITAAARSAAAALAAATLRSAAASQRFRQHFTLGQQQRYQLLQDGK